MDGHGLWNKGKSFSGGIVQTSCPFLIQLATKSHSVSFRQVYTCYCNRLYYFCILYLMFQAAEMGFEHLSVCPKR